MIPLERLSYSHTASLWQKRVTKYRFFSLAKRLTSCANLPLPLYFRSGGHPLVKRLPKLWPRVFQSSPEGLAPGPVGHGNRSKGLNAKFGSPAVFVSLVEWADRIIFE